MLVWYDDRTIDIWTHYITYFVFNDAAASESYPLALHDALPISRSTSARLGGRWPSFPSSGPPRRWRASSFSSPRRPPSPDRKSTRLNSSHPNISYAVFCLKKKQSHLLSINPYNILLHSQPSHIS